MVCCEIIYDKISASPPAFSTALAVSYSQLVPGNTGIRALATPQSCLVPYRLLVVYHLRVLSSQVLFAAVHRFKLALILPSICMRSLTTFLAADCDSRETSLARLHNRSQIYILAWFLIAFPYACKHLSWNTRIELRSQHCYRLPS